MSFRKLPPRQKMINMMYLVLTAMLALNVSKEILKAFHLVETSMERSGQNIDEKNQLLLQSFEKSLQDFPEKTRPHYDKAQQAVLLTDSFISYVDRLKAVLEKKAKGRDVETGELVKADNVSLHAQLLINQGKATELKQKIDLTREQLLALVDEHARAFIKTDLYARPAPGSDQSWESQFFEHPPLAAVVTVLAQIKNDARNTEAQVLSYLWSKVGGNDIPVDKMAAKVIPSSNYVMLGEPYEAEILVAAYNSTQNHEMLVNNKPVHVRNGVGTYRTTTSEEGLFSYNGSVNVRQSDGTLKAYPFSSEYMVFKPMATISAEQTNVIYAGLDNPVQIAVPGFLPSQLIVSTSTGSRISGSNGNYTVQATPGLNELNISTSVRLEDGTIKPMGSKKFKVRRVPSPIPAIGGLSSGKVSRATFQANNRISCILENFIFTGVSYEVTSYRIEFKPKRGGNSIEKRGNSSRIPGEILSALRNASTGDQLFVWDIKAQAKGTQIGIRKLRTGIHLVIK